jgi:hypothetical protein
MTQIQNPRRFYIDHAGDQPIVRTVPVRRPEPQQAIVETSESVATHQSAPAVTSHESPFGLAARARRAPQRVSRIVKTARKRTHHQSS